MQLHPPLESAESEAGFTLVEALLALAIGALVVMLSLSSLRSASAFLSGFITHGRQAETLARAGAILAGDALRARSIRDGAGTLLFSGTTGEVIFAEAARPTAGWVGMSMVRLSLLRDGADTLLVRSEAPLDHQIGGVWTEPVTLWRSKADLGLRYLDASSDWGLDWEGEVLPRAFGVALVGGGEFPMLVAEFPKLVEPGCAQPPPAPCRLRKEGAP